MKRLLFLINLFFCSHLSNAQQTVNPENSGPKKDTLVPLNIRHTDKLGEKTKDSVKFLYLSGNVLLQKGSTLYYADSVVRNEKDSIIEAFGHVHMNDSDTTNIFSDYMKYYEAKKYVYFQKNVKMTDGKAILYTDDLNYDLSQKIGTYNNGGKLFNKGSVLTSKEGVYYADTKDIYFKNDVVLKDPAYDLNTDSMLYNTQSEYATFITRTHIRDSSGSTIDTKEGNYDMKNHRAQFGRRPRIKQGSQNITGDFVKFDDSTGISVADGNAVFVDSTQGVSVLSTHMIADKKSKTFLATGKPLMILKQEDDSIYVAADTLFSGRLSDLIRADSIARYYDSVKTEKRRIQDSLLNDSLLGIRIRITDSIALVNEAIMKENLRIQDSAMRAHIDIPDSVFLKGVIAEQKTILEEGAHRHGRGRKQAQKTNSQTDQKPANPDQKQLNANPKDSTSKSPPSLNAAGNKSSGSDSLKSPTVTRDSLKGDLPINHSGTGIDTATHRPPQTKDSLDNDTSKRIYTVTVSPNDSADRFLQAYHHVRIFSDSLQAISDSMFYSGKDSVFRLFTDPIVWANGNQITGDTIYLFTKNKKSDRLYVFENGLAVNKLGNGLFNQIKGKTINGYFREGVIDHMRAKGNAESIYYAQDDNKAFFGVNQSKADIIDMLFVNKELNKVILRNEAEGTMYPIKKVNIDEMRLKNFKWLDDKRPKTKYELFGQ